MTIGDVNEQEYCFLLVMFMDKGSWIGGIILVMLMNRCISVMLTN
jgi:hypothetical protein